MGELHRDGRRRAYSEGMRSARRGGCPVDHGSQMRVEGFASAVHVQGSPGVLGVAVGGDELGQSEALLLVVTQREQQARSVLGARDRELGVQAEAHRLARQQGLHPLRERVGGLRGGVIDEHLALAVVFAGFLARDHQFLALELLEQAVGVVGVDSPGLAQAHAHAVCQVAAVTRTLEHESQQDASHRSGPAAQPLSLLGLDPGTRHARSDLLRHDFVQFVARDP